MYARISVYVYTYGVGYSVACSGLQAIPEPQFAEQQYCSPAFCIGLIINKIHELMKHKIFTLLFAILASAEIMNAAITVRLNPQSTGSWSNVYLWAWVTEESGKEVNLFAEWPGIVVSKDAEEWYSYTFDESLTNVNIIWSDGTNQTIDINGVTVSTCYALTSTSGKQIGVSVVDCTTGEVETVSYVKIGDLYYNLDMQTKTAEVTYKLKFSSSNYLGLTIANIPASVEYNARTFSVTSLGDYAFFGCSGLTSLTIPNSVTSIGVEAFGDCTGLTAVAIPNSVTSIGRNAFYGCTGLTTITIPNGIVTIEPGTFGECSNLASVTIPNSVTSIGDFAFYGCTGLTSITIPHGVTSIGEYAFHSCKGMTSITISNSVTSIGDFAFYGCTGLTSLTIPNSVTSIEGGAFANCTGLTAVAIPNSVTSIGRNAFVYCTSLSSIEIPNSVTSIGGGAFEYCTSLSSIEIPNSVTNIGGAAFRGCTGLNSITCEATIPPAMGYTSFGNEVYYDVFRDVDKSIPLYVPAGSVDAYKAADQWKEFTNILPIEEPVTDYTVTYLDKEALAIDHELITLNLPEPPTIDGFKFIEWMVVAGKLAEGILIQAVYEAEEPTSAPAVVVNPANPAQKLIRNGNVYILRGEKVYTVQGMEIH